MKSCGKFSHQCKLGFSLSLSHFIMHLPLNPLMAYTVYLHFELHDWLAIY